jgi:hypothetical protein
MTIAPEAMLVGAVVAVGVLHTLVPDHWLPIAIWARRSHWSRLQTARAALIAGLGHTLSTLAIGAIVWLAGVALAVRFGHFIAMLSSWALIGFGLWIAFASWRELRLGEDARERGADADAQRPAERPNARMALLFILGSSPMVEGIPAFFAAARFGPRLVGLMALCFAASTMATYCTLCVYSGATLQRVRLGAFERYGEVLSGAVIALVGIVFVLWPFR